MGYKYQGVELRQILSGQHSESSPRVHVQVSAAEHQMRLRAPAEISEGAPGGVGYDFCEDRERH